MRNEFYPVVADVVRKAVGARRVIVFTTFRSNQRSSADGGAYDHQRAQ